MYPLILFILALIGATLHLTFSKTKRDFKRVVEVLLAYIIPLNIGVATLLGFISHVFYGPETAKMIGWPPNNPFQFEVGIGNLAMCVAGLLSIWQRKGFWFATVIFAGVFFLGAAYGHFVQMGLGDYSPYNTGVFLYVGDIFIPLIYIILGFIYAAQNRFFKNQV